jgi:hypothetical protein
MLMTREKFEEHLEILKGVSTEKFNSMTEYTEHEVESWLVSYVNKNEDIEDTLHQLSIDLRELEGTLFDIKVRQEIIHCTNERIYQKLVKARFNQDN